MRVPACLFPLVILAGCSAGDPPAHKSTPPAPPASSRTKAATSAASTPAARPESTPPAEAAALRLREIDLWNAYDENTIAADARYKGKTLDVDGEVSVIEADWIGFNIVADDTRANVVCRIEPAHKAGFAAARKGERFRVKGICQGAEERLGVYKDRVIVLEKCRPAGSR